MSAPDKKPDPVPTKPVDFDHLTFRNRVERIDVSPCGTEGCLWDNDYWAWTGEEEPGHE